MGVVRLECGEHVPISLAEDVAGFGRGILHALSGFDDEAAGAGDELVLSSGGGVHLLPLVRPTAIGCRDRGWSFSRELLASKMREEPGRNF